MDELGTILQEARTARELTLEDVAQVTRIRVRYLEALEEGRYDVLPTPVHVRGFLRNYAQYLNLDPEPLIARYNASRRMVQDIPLEKQVRPELGKAPPPPPETLDEELESGPVFFRPLGSNLQAPGWLSGEMLVGALGIILLLVFLYFIGGRFIIPALTEARAFETPVVEDETAVVPVETTRVAIASPTRAVGPTQEATRPPILSIIQLEITVVERSWLKVEVDGETVQEGMAAVGDLFAWDGLELVKLSTGNGAGLDVTLNGQPLGQLGGRGEVVDKIWTLSGEIEPTPMPTLAPAATPEPTEETEPAEGG